MAITEILVHVDHQITGRLRRPGSARPWSWLRRPKAHVSALLHQFVSMFTKRDEEAK